MTGQFQNHLLMQASQSALISSEYESPVFRNSKPLADRDVKENKQLPIFKNRDLNVQSKNSAYDLGELTDDTVDPVHEVSPHNIKNDTYNFNDNENQNEQRFDIKNDMARTIILEEKHTPNLNSSDSVPKLSITKRKQSKGEKIKPKMKTGFKFLKPNQ